MRGKNYHDASGKVTSPVAIATALPLQKKSQGKTGTGADVHIPCPVHLRLLGAFPS